MSKPTYSSGKRKEKKAISWETADPAQGAMLSDTAFRELQTPLHLSNPGWEDRPPIFHIWFELGPEAEICDRYPFCSAPSPAPP